MGLRFSMVTLWTYCFLLSLPPSTKRVEEPEARRSSLNGLSQPNSTRLEGVSSIVDQVAVIAEPSSVKIGFI